LMTEAFNIGVVGCRYVGLVTGACLSHLGHRAVCVDKDEERIRALESGRLPFHEPGLEQFTKKGGISSGCLRFSTELAPTVQGADVVSVCVDTPQSADGSADLSSVAAVARDIGRALAEQ